VNSWWELGNKARYFGNDLAIREVVCPFCQERGNFSLDHRATKKKPNASKALHFDTLRCVTCANYVMVLWSTSDFGPEAHDFLTLPWVRRLSDFPKSWPEPIGRFWLQAHRSCSDESWDAAAVMARSAVQAAMQDQGAQGGSLYAEINDLAGRGALPPHMKDWAHEIRLLGNESAHPHADRGKPAPGDVRDILRFLDFLFEYLYTLPGEIERYRERRNGQTNAD